MRKSTGKLSLDVERLSVESFETASSGDGRGTVRARQEGGEIGDDAAVAPCTCYRTCLCPSAPYFCADAPQTAISCTYTLNTSCIAVAEG